MDFSGKKVLVYGAGKSGIGAVNLLVKLGAHPVLFDEKPGLTGEQMLAGVDEPGEVTVCAGTCRPDTEMRPWPGKQARQTMS